ncbi:MAG: helix-turn-helix domain-containing protein [Bacteroidales bacterium]
MTTGEKISKLCKERGVPPYKLFKAINKTPSSVYRILRQKTINSDTLRLIADYFKVDVSTLLSDSTVHGDTKSGDFENVTKLPDSDKYIEALESKIAELQNNIAVKDIQIECLRTEITSKEEIIRTKDQLINLLRINRDSQKKSDQTS